LAAGVITRQDAAAWAAFWLQRDAQLADEVLIGGLSTLVLADAKQLPNGDLYGRVNFQAWLSEFERNISTG
jgi:hypothetical protein